MLSDREQKALRDILYHIELVERFTQNQTFENFQIDTLHLYAVTRCLEIISEASRRLSNELKARYTNIAWKDMAAAGNIYRHNYDGIAARRIWETVQRALPALRKVIEQELAKGA